MTVEQFLEEWNNDSTTMLVHTSGSTGAPKPLRVEKKRMVASAQTTCDFLDLHPGDTALLCMPLDYIAGKMMVVRALVRGMRLVCVPAGGNPFLLVNSAGALVENVECRVESYDYILVNSEEGLVKSEELKVKSYDFSQLECNHNSTLSTLHSTLKCNHNSTLSTLHSTLKSNHNSSLFTLHSSLTNHNSTLSTLHSTLKIDFAALVPLQVYNALQQPESRRRLMEVRQLIIGGGAIDEALARELRAFPNGVWSTYGMTETLSHVALRRLSGPEATEWYTPLPSVQVSLSAEGCLVVEAPLVCDGPLTTNDVAELAPDGRRFRILGRRDNTICSGGIKIQAEQVEQMLRPHVAAEMMITHVSDPKFGQAVVLLHTPTRQNLRDVCRRVLPRYSVPRHFVAVDRLPTTPNGKPARREAELLARRLCSAQQE